MEDITADGKHTELVVCRQGLNYSTRSITTECPINVTKYNEVSQPEGQHNKLSCFNCHTTRRLILHTYCK